MLESAAALEAGLLSEGYRALCMEDLIISSYETRARPDWNTGQLNRRSSLVACKDAESVQPQREGRPDAEYHYRSR